MRTLVDLCSKMEFMTVVLGAGCVVCRPGKCVKLPVLFGTTRGLAFLSFLSYQRMCTNSRTITFLTLHVPWILVWNRWEGGIVPWFSLSY